MDTRVRKSSGEGNPTGGDTMRKRTREEIWRDIIFACVLVRDYSASEFRSAVLSETF